ncbi:MULTISPECIES: hypothetical protein [unclassified Xanthomonas]|uniref:hypothetical protein n=1 Tax=unclassified Xanthomonas TaxID=2643310 RepID=UPI002A7F9B6B|nr:MULTISPECIES: hypothetical protein [unclassified Xanthomonas]MDY4297509.1 hypothetical protein [Xanthomonas sp. LF02-5]MDY4359303.1 hypothetical protein [Xanthomonas sp. LF04-12]
MSVGNLLYDRPDLDQTLGVLPLRVVGMLPGYRLLMPYEGRLQIQNAIGPCSVLQIGGDQLPPGAMVFVDNATSEVVVAWPAYSANVTPLFNPGLENGNLGGWNITLSGQQSASPKAIEVSTARPFAGQYSAYYLGETGVGHAGGIEALWTNTTIGRCYPTQVVVASAMIALDDTDKSQNRGNVRLIWQDADGNVLRTSQGNLIRGNNSRYQESRVSAAAPVGASQVRFAVWTTANYSGGVRFDNAMWNLPTIIGLNEDRQFYIQLRVRDSAGREALWAGYIGEQALYYTTQLYPIVMPADGLQAGTGITGGVVRVPPTYQFMDSLGNASLTILGGELRPLVRAYTAWPPEAVSTSMTILTGEIRQILKSYTIPPESVTPAMAITGGEIRAILVQYTIPLESITPAATITGGTLA